MANKRFAKRATIRANKRQLHRQQLRFANAICWHIRLFVKLLLLYPAQFFESSSAGSKIKEYIYICVCLSDVVFLRLYVYIYIYRGCFLMETCKISVLGGGEGGRAQWSV